MFRMSGIFRDVYLFNVPTAYVFDHQITTSLRNNYKDATLQFNFDVRNPSAEKQDKQLDVKVFDPKGKLVAKDMLQFTADAHRDSTFSQYTLNLDVNNVALWTAETPQLYTVRFVQRNGNGAEEMAWSTKVGFREVKLQGSLLYVNGKRVLLKGVNRQDTDPKLGRAVTNETMLRDILLMKQNNINTIRTSHYPNNARMYAMYDYYGLYTCDEADLEDHANQSISDLKSWVPPSLIALTAWSSATLTILLSLCGAWEMKEETVKTLEIATTTPSNSTTRALFTTKARASTVLLVENASRICIPRCIPT